MYSSHRLTHAGKKNTVLRWSSPAGLLNLSWDNLLWGNEELEGRKEASEDLQVLTPVTVTQEEPQACGYQYQQQPPPNQHITSSQLPGDL